MTEMRRDPRRATPPDASCPGILVAVPRSGGRTSVIVTTVAVMSQAVAGIVRVARPRAVSEVIRPSCAAGIRTVNRAPTLDNSITDQ